MISRHLHVSLVTFPASCRPRCLRTATNASAALAASPDMSGENVNYAVKSPDASGLSFLESVPDVDAKLKSPNTADEKFEDVVKSAQDAAVLVLVY